MSLLINHFYRFGEFLLDTDQRVLLREGKPLALAPKVFDTLRILVEQSGRIVSKEELMTRLWPRTFVEEANLTYNIQQLRKTLGDDARNPVFIETVARRGYRFIARVEEVLSDNGAASSRITQHFESSHVESSRPGAETDVAAKSQNQSAAVASADYGQVAAPEKVAELEKRVDVAAPRAAASKRISSKSIAITAALVVVLVVVGIVMAMFFSGANETASDNRRADARSAVALPLKIEKLTATGQSSHVAISPDGKYLAYTQAFDKRPSIWLRQLATNTNIEIVTAARLEAIKSLEFTNNGEYLYYVKGEPTALYRISSLGGVPTKIVDELESRFSISADDSRIAFIRRVINQDGKRENFLIIANSDGTGSHTLMKSPHPETLNAPVWSPDNESIICVYVTAAGGKHEGRLIEVRVADGMKKELSADRFFDVIKMVWLPNKSGLIISARKKHEDENQLWHLKYPSMEISRITEGLDNYTDLSVASDAEKAAAAQANRISHLWIGSSREPRNLKKIVQGTESFCWTPNGQIVYSSKASGNVDIWVMQPDGSGQRQLTVNPTIDGTPAVTPDNRYIVFVSNRTGAYEIWRMNSDGSNQIQLTRGGGTRPTISHDGKWVLYNTTNWQLWKMPIDGGEPLPVAEYTAFYPSVSPDGKMIACVGRDDTNRKLSIVVLPFEGGQPLKRFDFTGGSFRGFRLQWSPDGKALIYGIEQNKETSLLKQSLDGGPPEQIMGFEEDELNDFGYSMDRKFFAVTRAGWQHDIVLISNLNLY